MSQPKRYDPTKPERVQYLPNRAGDVQFESDSLKWQNARLRSAFDELLNEVRSLAEEVALNGMSGPDIVQWCDAAIENAEKERT